jgi:hypothetical protein
MKFIDTLDPIYIISSQEYYNVTLEQLDIGKNEIARKSRLEVLILMDEVSREKLRKNEYLTYSRRKNAPEIPPCDPKHPWEIPLAPLDTNPPPQTTLPKKNDTDLNIDMASISAKVNVLVPLLEIMKVPYLRDKVKNFLSFQDELEDPLSLL